MESQNPFKFRLSRMFRTSLGSCKSKDITDDISRPNLVQNNRQHYQLFELFSPQPNPFPSICKPKCSENPKTELFHRQKVSDGNSLLARANTGSQKHYCSPESSTTPLHTFFDFQTSKPKPKGKKSKKKKNKKKQIMKRSNFESLDSYYDLFSSDDDDESTLFSLKSRSSDSSDSLRQKHTNQQRRKASKKEDEICFVPLEGKVKDSFAVVKRSSDPYDDFRTSMLEMIIKKQIFGARDLENLLYTFLSLNSHLHHRVIIEVFTEICDALFSNCS